METFPEVEKDNNRIIPMATLAIQNHSVPAHPKIPAMYILIKYL